MRDIQKGFNIVASFPTLKNLPIIIGESDPEGCAACPADIYPNNDYRNGTLYSSYTAASFARKYDLAKNRGINLKGVVTWAFEFEDQPWFRGFRDLATNGVDKPVLNVFRLFGMMQGNTVPVVSNSNYNYISVRDSSVRSNKPDINGLAAANDHSASVMLWNYHDKNDLNVAAAPVAVSVNSIPSKKIMLLHYRIDQEHSNSFTAWKKMGSPQQPTPAQVEQLERAGALQLLGSPQWIVVKEGKVKVEFDLPRQGVSLLKITW